MAVAEYRVGFGIATSSEACVDSALIRLVLAGHARISFASVNALLQRASVKHQITMRQFSIGKQPLQEEQS